MKNLHKLDLIDKLSKVKAQESKSEKALEKTIKVLLKLKK